MISTEHPLVLIGCGHMGSALVRGWRAAGIGPLIIVDSNQEKLAEFHDDPDIATYATPDALIGDFTPSAICLATKPDMLVDVLRGLSAHQLDTPPLILSVAAGMDLSFYETHCWDHTPIVRIMPNLGSTVGEGMSACVANGATTESHKALATQLCDAVGKTLWLEDESMMDAVTAVSGSGPAYYFALMEAMIDKAIAFGFSRADARLLVGQTALGAASFAAQSDETVTHLRQSVASPGGTTQAALDVFLSDDAHSLTALTDRAMQAAKDQSEKLRSLNK